MTKKNIFPIVVGSPDILLDYRVILFSVLSAKYYKKLLQKAYLYLERLNVLTLVLLFLWC